MFSKRYGIIDIGTLKTKIVIADVEKGNIKILYQDNKLTRLGLRANENNGTAWPEYIEATIDYLKECRQKLAEFKVTNIKAVSTHALREMKNGQEVADIISTKTGLTIEIISQAKEAELFFQAVTQDFRTTDQLAIADIGSGSVQILIGSPNNLEQSFLTNSGAQYLHDTLSPRHTDKDCPTEEEADKMSRFIKLSIKDLPEGLKTPLIYGSSCVIDAFKIIGLPLEPYPHSKSHPFKTNISHLQRFYEEIIHMPYGERAQKYVYQSQPFYMWGIDTAFLNVIEIAKRLNSPYIIPSNANIALGIMHEMTSTSLT